MSAERLAAIDLVLADPKTEVGARVTLLEEKLTLMSKKSPEPETHPGDLDDEAFVKTYGRERSSTERIAAGLRARKVGKLLDKLNKY